MNASSPPSSPAKSEKSLKKIAAASVIGTTVEWYDLFVFATASALVFNKIFFPKFDPLIGTLLAFGTFASAYLARIVGAAIFGHYGDRLGRKSMLLISLIMMGTATFAIGLLPDYESIGIWAPILLLTLRVIQGLALGGEWGGAVLMAVEHAPPSKRGLYGSWVQIGVPAGTLIANLAFLLCNAFMSTESLLSWGWRIPFLASVLLVAVGMYIRLNTSETPSFQKVQQESKQVKMPLLEVLGKNWRQVILGGVATMSTGTAFNLIVSFGLTYGTQTLGFSRNEMLSLALLSCAVCMVLIPFFGWLSDKVGRKPVILGGIIAEALFAFPLFWLMDTKVLYLALLGYILMMSAFAANYGPIATFLAELFSTKVRYSGLSVSYMFSGLLGSAATPVITTALLSATGHGSSIGWLAIGSATLSALALLKLVDSMREPAESTANSSSAKNGIAIETVQSLSPSLVSRLEAVSIPTLGHLVETGFADFGLRAQVPGGRIVGRAVTLRLVKPDAFAVNKALSVLTQGDVLVIDMMGNHTHAPVGAVTACAAACAGAKGIIVDGVVTDIKELNEQGLPVFSRGTSSLTTKRYDGFGSEINVPVQCGNVLVRPGDVVLADDNGVLFIDVGLAASIIDEALASDRAEPSLLARLRAGEPAGNVLALH